MPGERGEAAPDVPARGRGLDAASPAPERPLSPRERAILLAIAGGRSNARIARELGLSDQTVKNHMANIMRKLGAPDRTAAVVLALQRGWVSLRSIRVVPRSTPSDARPPDRDATHGGPAHRERAA